MSVLIKGMEMPKNCGRCFLRVGQCSKRIYMESRPLDCPLIELPPHGRLIDADAVMLHIQEYIEEYDDDLSDSGYHSEKWCAMKEAEMVINDAPTIIEAEGGDAK